MKFEQALNELLKYMPPDGIIRWETEKNDNNERITRICIPPCAFMHIYTPNDKRIVSVSKRAFWNEQSVDYVARAKWGNYFLETSLSKTLPRDFKWLSERKY